MAITCQMASHVWQIVTAIYTDTVFVHLNMCKQLHVTSKQLTENIFSLFLLFWGEIIQKTTISFSKDKMSTQKHNSSILSSSEPFKKTMLSKHHCDYKQAKLKACHYCPSKFISTIKTCSIMLELTWHIYHCIQKNWNEDFMTIYRVEYMMAS